MLWTVNIIPRFIKFAISKVIEQRGIIPRSSRIKYYRTFETGYRTWIFYVLSTAVLLVLSFPVYECWGFAWVALIPFFLLLDRYRSWAGFGIGYGVGVLFFFGTLFWFIHVTLPGMILLNCYLAIYFAIFGYLYCFFSSQKSFVKLFLIPSLWVSLEYIRSHFLTGFGWVCLGQSQYKNVVMIQMCDVTGMFGISFILVMVNVLLKEWLAVYLFRVSKFRTELIHMSLVVLLVLGICFGYGLFCIQKIKISSGGSVAVVQANIAQSQKWQRSQWPKIMEKYRNLTVKAAMSNPQLIIWPETAFPGFIWEAPDLFIDLKDFVHQQTVPLLLGVVTQLNEEYFNSAILLSAEGEFIGQYDKLHLVPFGEYVPFRKLFPFLSNIVPIGDFSSGHQYKVFDIPQKNAIPQKSLSFSVLICFEDTVPELARRFTKEGTQFFINITNDAWFLDTPASFMHLQSAVFRTVENRRGMIRAANTGVSCFVDPLGRIYSPVQIHGDEMIFVDGVSVADVRLSDKKAFYTKFGDVFTYFCFGCILWAIWRQFKKIIFFPKLIGRSKDGES